VRRLVAPCIYRLFFKSWVLIIVVNKSVLSDTKWQCGSQSHVFLQATGLTKHTYYVGWQTSKWVQSVHLLELNQWLLQVMFPSACSFIVFWFSLSYTICFSLHGHVQVCRILHIFLFICLKDSAFSSFIRIESIVIAGYVSVCIQLYCILVFTVLHYMFWPTWPSSSV
jgi:hypothetical protein